MALIIHSSSCLLSKKPSLLLRYPTKPTTQFFIRSQESSESSKPTTVTQPIDDSSTRKPASAGLGFGSSSSSSSPKSKQNPASSNDKKQKDEGRRGRASVIRRTPLEKPDFLPEKEEGGQADEKLENENAFLLTWLGLGSIIFIQGIALSASGFLPEEWDKLIVKYVYSSFTPTVFLFVAGTVGYGVLKYLQNDKLKKQ